MGSESIAEDYQEAMRQIAVCHSLLDVVGVPRLVEAEDGKGGSLPNRLSSYLDQHRNGTITIEEKVVGTTLGDRDRGTWRCQRNF